MTLTLASPAEVFDPTHRYSIEEWIALEEATGRRFEYEDGRLFDIEAMAGGTPRHALVMGNLVGTLFQELTRASGCENCSVYASDLQIKSTMGRRYVYPDATVICGEPEYDAVVKSAVRNPVIVAEVVSPGTFARDFGEKFDYYASLPSVRDYLLVHQDRARVEVRSRSADEEGVWETRVFVGLDARATLSGLAGVAIEFAMLYRRVIFDDAVEVGQEAPSAK